MKIEIVPPGTLLDPIKRALEANAPAVEKGVPYHFTIFNDFGNTYSYHVINDDKNARYLDLEHMHMDACIGIVSFMYVSVKHAPQRIKTGWFDRKKLPTPSFSFSEMEEALVKELCHRQDKDDNKPYVISEAQTTTEKLYARNNGIMAMMTSCAYLINRDEDIMYAEPVLDSLAPTANAIESIDLMKGDATQVLRFFLRGVKG